MDHVLVLHGDLGTDIMNHAAVNTGVQTPVQVPAFTSLGFILRSGVAGSQGGCIFMFLRNSHSVFCRGCTIFLSSHFWWRHEIVGYPLQRMQPWVEGEQWPGSLKTTGPEMATWALIPALLLTPKLEDLDQSFHLSWPLRPQPGDGGFNSTCLWSCCASPKSKP